MTTLNLQPANSKSLWPMPAQSAAQQNSMIYCTGYNQPMPTIMQIGRYRFFFFSNENREPAHIHVKAGEDEAKFWLDTLHLAANHGFREREINEIERLIEENRETFQEAWDDYFDN